MARVFVTGSADGLGLLAGERLEREGHEVVFHARSRERARAALPKKQHVVIGDVATLDAMKSVASQANALGRFDAVIHNVAIGYQEGARAVTADGLERVFAINVLAPYVLTALIERPARLVYLSSGLHRSGTPNMDDPEFERRPWNGMQAYSDSKLYDVVLAFAIARRWPDVLSNALEPGWVPTKMGGRSAPDDLEEGAVTQAWLAVSDDANAKTTAGYFFHQKPEPVHPMARDAAFQDAFMEYCASVSGIRCP